MNQTTVLDWLGIDVWRLRVPSPIPAATPPMAVPAGAHEVQPVARASPLIDVEPMPEPVADLPAAPVSVSESPATPSPAPSSRILTLCVPAGGATLPLFARIAQTVPRSVTVVNESTEITSSSLIRWQGQDWLLRDLRQDPGLKRRLWRALCIPASSAE
ncbi:MAG TPA: hypothetical protein VMV35_11190 [Halothiobacillus sp.]|nr:hypothetical protein [Halothiobacillus sp.]